MKITRRQFNKTSLAAVLGVGVLASTTRRLHATDTSFIAGEYSGVQGSVTMVAPATWSFCPGQVGYNPPGSPAYPFEQTSVPMGTPVAGYQEIRTFVTGPYTHTITANHWFGQPLNQCNHRLDHMQEINVVTTITLQGTVFTARTRTRIRRQWQCVAGLGVRCSIEERATDRYFGGEFRDAEGNSLMHSSGVALTNDFDIYESGALNMVYEISQWDPATNEWTTRPQPNPPFSVGQTIARPKVKCGTAIVNGSEPPVYTSGITLSLNCCGTPVGSY